MKIKTCELFTCDNQKKITRGLCEKHYARLLRHGSTDFNLRIKNRKCSIKNCDRKHNCSGLCKLHYGRKIYAEKPIPNWNTSWSKELKKAMYRVRKRDNNMCKWQDCNLNTNVIRIHVHHIFPRSEYPELQLIERYMICYCVYHHFLFHKYRGDEAGKLFKNIDKGLDFNRLKKTYVNEEIMVLR